MIDLDLLSIRATAAFTEVHRKAFLGDPAANPRLSVEVVEAVRVLDTPTLVIVTPWTLNGLIFPVRDGFPHELDLAGQSRPVFEVTLPPLGRFHTVNLVSNVWGLGDQRRARALARSWGGPFRQAVLAALTAPPEAAGEAADAAADEAHLTA
jgi:hypothetical protein